MPKWCGATTKALLLPVKVILVAPVNGRAILLAFSMIRPTSSYRTVMGAEPFASKLRLTDVGKTLLLSMAVELMVARLPDWQLEGLLQP